MSEERKSDVNTFTEYKPAKLKIGVDHPDAIIESATLASVSPTDIVYKLALSNQLIQNGLLSVVQLENVIYACQAHDKFFPHGHRVGFLIGDGAGVGKGRSIAGIIYENFLRGRKKSVWLSCSTDLRYDAERDIRDIGAKTSVTVHDMKKVS